VLATKLQSYITPDILEELANLIDYYLPSSSRRISKKSSANEKKGDSRAPHSPRSPRGDSKRTRDKDGKGKKDGSKGKGRGTEGKNQTKKIADLPNAKEIKDILKFWLDGCNLGTLQSREQYS
jgi:hypothetical protein